MITIGIIGSDNSHAMEFSKLANLLDAQGRYLFDDVRVTEIYGQDPERTMEVARAGAIPHIAHHPDDLIGKVDAVMVVFRDGRLHAPYALPFIEAGIPTWVDKPFAIEYEKALSMTESAKKHHTILAGGSTCKYCHDVLTLKDDFDQLSQSTGVISGSFNFPGEINSKYNGIYFYGGHAAEILFTIFGTEAVSIKTDVYRDNLIALVKYSNFTVTINFADAPQYYCTIYSPSAVVNRPIELSAIYKLGFSKFVEALQKGKMVESFESLLHPVRFLNALEEAIRTGCEVPVS